jgi:hypothetical protein
MSFDPGLFFRSREHRGCDIRAASFKVGPRSWVPEACVHMPTDGGAMKLWVRSFAHCFAAENVTFTNKIEADNWAFSAARAIIDKALPDFDPPASPRTPLFTSRLDKFFKSALHPLSSLRLVQRFRRAS